MPVEHAADHDDAGSALEKASAHSGLEVHSEPIVHERPEDWGWHADLHKLARVGGVFSIVVLLIGLTASHYNNAGTAAILIMIGLLVIGLIVDGSHRRRSFRR